uniref:Secreted protein n=1 Tax=Strongyloides venezuelensis TaxID=75913 RepID=A0A0K0FEE0_STRVS
MCSDCFAIFLKVSVAIIGIFAPESINVSTEKLFKEILIETTGFLIETGEQSLILLISLFNSFIKTEFLLLNLSLFLNFSLCCFGTSVLVCVGDCVHIFLVYADSTVFLNFRYASCVSSDSRYFSVNSG